MALTKIPSSLLDTSSGLDLSGNITLGDNEQILLGDSSDLRLYHDGTNSYIDDNGDGNLTFRTVNQFQFEKFNTELLMELNADGAVNLYYDNSKKFETSSAGATVTGTLTVTGDLDITGNINSYNVTDLDVTDQTITLGAGQTEANSGGSGIIVDGSGASILWDETNTEWDFNNSINVTGIITAGDTGSVSSPTITFSGDTDTGIYRPAANQLGFATAGTNALTIDASQNVIVNDSSGTADFRVEGNTNTHLLFTDGTLDRVGINTNAPIAKLSVKNNVSTDYDTTTNTWNDFSGTQLTLENADNGSENNHASLGFYTAGNNGNFTSRISSVCEASGRGYLAFLLRSSNHTGDVREKMKLSHGGTLTVAGGLIVNTDTLYVDSTNNRVGIGTDNPDSPLEISSADDTRLKITDTGDSSELVFRSDGANTQIYTNTAHDLNIYTTGNVGQLYLDQSNANVGIDTTGPSAKLHVTGDKYVLTNSGRAAGGIHLTPNTSTAANEYGTGISFSNGGAGSAAIIGVNNNGGDHDTVGLAFITHPSSTGGNDGVEMMRLTPEGSLQFWNNSSIVGSITTTSSGTTYNTTSDKKLKENIEPIIDGKQKLMSMKPSTFNFISDEEKKKIHGFIAQEMQEIIPESITSNDELLSMDYGRITPILVAALQDAFKEIEELKNKLESK